MTFINEQLEVDGFPSASEISFKALEPSYKTYSYLSVAILFGIIFLSTVLPLLFSGFFDSYNKILIYFGVFMVLLLLSLFIKNRAYGKKGYAIRTHDVIFKSGIWWKRKTFVPRNRIQHVEIKKSAMEDWFDISRLLIFTAGGSSSDLVIPGLHPDRAEKIKTFLMNKLTAANEEE